MISIENIITSLQSLKADVSDISSKLTRESEYINETIGKVHSEFADQQEGQRLAVTLLKAMEELTFADSAMYRVSQGLDKAAEKLRK